MTMPKTSAGLLMYRHQGGALQVLLVHPGGPFFINKDVGAWSIPKGEAALDEDLFAAAQREFEEETGLKPAGRFIPLKPVKQRGGKIVYAWAFQGDCDPGTLKSNRFSLEWPPHSGNRQEFLEIDQAEFFDLETAMRKINSGQVDLLEELAALLRVDQSMMIREPRRHLP